MTSLGLFQAHINCKIDYKAEWGERYDVNWLQNGDMDGLGLGQWE